MDAISLMNNLDGVEQHLDRAINHWSNTESSYESRAIDELIAAVRLLRHCVQELAAIP